MAEISPIAVVDPHATLAEDVVIGPFCVIGPNVKIGRGTVLHNNVTLTGQVIIGEQNEIFPNAVIGCPPQDLTFRGESSATLIGDHNIIRENVTIHRGSAKEQHVTEIGSHNYLMAGTHIAHDCRLGHHIVIANGSLLGGHVHVQDHASISGGVAIHHYTTIGNFSFVAGMSQVRRDVPPFTLIEGVPAQQDVSMWSP